jgi:peptidoglycan-associated lipoprotein
MKKSLLSLILMITLLIAAQRKAKAQYILKAADAQYELFNYSKAIDLYEQAYKKKATRYAAERLGACNASLHNYRQTESWYAIAVAMPGGSVENHLNYARALQNNSKYTEAKAEYRKYAAQNTKVTPVQSSLWILSCDSALNWMAHPVKVQFRDAQALSSPQSDWGAVDYNGGLVFVSDRVNGTMKQEKEKKPFLKFDGAKSPDKKNYGWTGNPYQRLYQKQKGTDSVHLFPFSAGTAYHVGPASFTEDGNEMYFAMTRVPEKEEYVKNQATINVEIYSSKRDSLGKWGVPVPFRYNNVNRYSVGDPYISKDGNSLYFVSNMPGGMGGTDLYVCLKSGPDGWAAPVNLKEVNTEGNERSPYFDRDNKFYFSSDGRIGMGGLDIYSAVWISGKLSRPVNLGYPFNSPQDDFAYSSSSDSTGYCSSNRLGGLGEDDIYSFTKKKMNLMFKLAGTVYNKSTHTPLANAIVSLSKNNGGTLKVETDSSGTYKFGLDEGSAYSLAGEKTNFRSEEAEVSTQSLQVSTAIQRDLYLEAVEMDKAIRLENIYYDFNKWNIRADAAVELDKLVKIMQDNPAIWIELGSHTDSRGNDAYNRALSQKRAESAVQYINSRGINRNRIEAKGYGETQLLNQCANGVPCTEAEHRLNRRTEFKIVKQ